MKFFVFLTLIGLCAYQFASIQAASTQNYRQKRYAEEGKCPEDKKTAEACLGPRSPNACEDAWSDGEYYSIRSCGIISRCSDEDGQRVDAIVDRSKPYPKCCPKCPRISYWI